MGNMRFKAGDRVKIKNLNWYNENKDEYGYVRCTDFLFTPEHSKYCGCEFTISHITEFRIPSYVMESNGHEWTDEMIEGLVEEETKSELKFKVGDKITNGKVILTILTLSSDRYIVEDNFGECGSLRFNTQDDWRLVEEESEKKLSDESWKPSKEEMDVLYGLAYITNQYDEHKEEIITRLYQDLKREFFNGSSYENMFPDTEDDVRRRSTIQILEYARSLDNYNQYGKEDIDKNIAWLEKQGKKPQGKSALEAINEKNIDNQNCVKPTDGVEPKFKVGDKIKLKSTLLNDIFGVIGYEPEGYRITNISNGLTYFMSYSIEHHYELVEEEVGLVDNLSSRWINEFNLPEGYIFKDENGNVINATKIVLEKKKKEYPKTYEECCEILDIIDNRSLWHGYRSVQLKTFQRLLICRDAYWKIAGEKMGLGGPWKPDYSGTFEQGTPIKYVIYNIGTHIVKERKSSPNHILSFPTAEMLDAFYENYKDLIKSCKELL